MDVIRQLKRGIWEKKYRLTIYCGTNDDLEAKVKEELSNLAKQYGLNLDLTINNPKSPIRIFCTHSAQEAERLTATIFSEADLVITKPSGDMVPNAVAVAVPCLFFPKCWQKHEKITGEKVVKAGLGWWLNLSGVEQQIDSLLIDKERPSHTKQQLQDLFILEQRRINSGSPRSRKELDDLYLEVLHRYQPSLAEVAYYLRNDSLVKSLLGWEVNGGENVAGIARNLLKKYHTSRIKLTK